MWTRVWYYLMPRLTVQPVYVSVSVNIDVSVSRCLCVCVDSCKDGDDSSVIKPRHCRHLPTCLLIR